MSGEGDRPTAASAPGLSGGGGSVFDMAAGRGEWHEQPGDRIGPYVLLSVIGEGGFGVVWLAERREPFVQRVALKIIKPGMDSRAVVARFEQERQALAVMDHPNIARVFDAGVTAREMGARPYFVMEHVPGESITGYCDRNRLSTRARLELFIKVCDAVQHAHTKGIIHRDLKPSNVLVVPGDPAAPEPNPKVIDFGVAKAIAHTMTEKTIFTERGQIVGTPEYMSPEQAEMSSTGIDTRSDVYSLGVMLYELLTGVLPFDPRTLRAAGYLEIQRIIREVEPPRPSTRLTTLGDEAAAIAARHRTEAHALTSELRRELEWVPLKALRKDRNERYGSPSDLARDIRNYLEGRPLEAGPESAGYRARKFVRRNRGAVIAAGLVVVALGGASAAVWQGRQRLAESRGHVSELRGLQDKVEMLEREASERITSADSSAVGAEPEAGLEWVALAARLRSELDGGKYSGDSEGEGSARLALARVLNRLGDAAAARPEAERALRIESERHKGTDTEKLADARTVTGLLLVRLGRLDEAEAQLKEALAMYRRLRLTDKHKVGRALNNLGGLLLERGRPGEAESAFLEALAINQRLDDNDGAVAANLNNLGLAVQEDGRLEEAEQYFRESLALNERLAAGDDERLAQALTNVGFILARRGQNGEAEGYLRAGLEMNQRLFMGDDPEIAAGLNNLGFVLVALGRASEAEPLARRAVTMRQRLHEGDDWRVCATMKNLGKCLAEVGRVEEGLDWAEQAAAMARRVLPVEHPTRVKCEKLVEELRAVGGGASSPPPAPP